MSTPTSLFCEHCGAANEPQATYCCFCGRPLQEPKTASYDAEKGSLLADAMLKGRYRIIKPVGQGGMGTVYHAQDTELNNRPVAVKEMILSGLSEKDITETIEAFKREATLLAGLQHPNLPSVFEHFEENDRWYMVMSFIQGETLEHYLERTKRTKLPLAEVLQMSKQLCAVLHYLHSQHPPIIFRDVKPANIMRAPDGQIYLIDFGVARRFKTGQKKDTAPFGSMGYAPPEQFGKAQTTPRSDIYSLGATMYQLLSGHEPDSTPFRFPQLHSLEPNVPVQLSTLLAQMLDHDEKKRPANMLIVEQKLQEITLAHAPLQPPSAFPTKQPVKQPAPFTRLGALILSIFCLVIGGFVGDGIGTLNANTTIQTNATATTVTAFDASTATASAQVNATATAVQAAALPDPYTPKGTLALVDPLDQASTWQPYTDTNWGGRCQFENNTFQVSQGKSDRFYHCDESTIYQNFTIEVKMIIVEGDCGGIVLRENPDGTQMYFFDVCVDGTYALYRYGANSSSSTLTAHSTNKAINQWGQVNVLAVVANGSNLDLYVNRQKLESVSDNSWSMGNIGFAADDNDIATTVAFQDVMIWALP